MLRVRYESPRCREVEPGLCAILSPGGCGWGGGRQEQPGTAGQGTAGVGMVGWRACRTGAEHQRGMVGERC